MNKKQLACLWIGIIVIVLMGLFPPWIIPSSSEGIKYRIDRGYKILFSPVEIQIPKTEVAFSAATLDMHRLCIQWFMVAVITGGLVCTFKNRPKDKEKKGTDK